MYRVLISFKAILGDIQKLLRRYDALLQGMQDAERSRRRRRRRRCLLLLEQLKRARERRFTVGLQLKRERLSTLGVPRTLTARVAGEAEGSAERSAESGCRRAGR